MHCSAGVGRTGTFISIDLARQALQDTGRVRVLNIIRGLRKERVAMVQTAVQYEFVHFAVQTYSRMCKKQLRPLEPEKGAEIKVAAKAIPGFSPRDIGRRVLVRGLDGVDGRLAWCGIHAIKQQPRVGIQFKKPIGKNDGSLTSHATGVPVTHRYFLCSIKHGVITVPDIVTLVEDSSEQDNGNLLGSPGKKKVAASRRPQGSAPGRRRPVKPNHPTHSTTAATEKATLLSDEPLHAPLPAGFNIRTVSASTSASKNPFAFATTSPTSPTPPGADTNPFTSLAKNKSQAPHTTTNVNTPAKPKTTPAALTSTHGSAPPTNHTIKPNNAKAAVVRNAPTNPFARRRQRPHQALGGDASTRPAAGMLRPQSRSRPSPAAAVKTTGGVPVKLDALDARRVDDAHNLANHLANAEVTTAKRKARQVSPSTRVAEKAPTMHTPPRERPASIVELGDMPIWQSLASSAKKGAPARSPSKSPRERPASVVELGDVPIWQSLAASSAKKGTLPRSPSTRPASIVQLGDQPIWQTIKESQTSDPQSRDWQATHCTPDNDYNSGLDSDTGHASDSSSSSSSSGISENINVDSSDINVNMGINDGDDTNMEKIMDGVLDIEADADADMEQTARDLAEMEAALHFAEERAKERDKVLVVALHPVALATFVRVLLRSCVCLCLFRCISTPQLAFSPVWFVASQPHQLAFAPVCFGASQHHQLAFATSRAFCVCV